MTVSLCGITGRAGEVVRGRWALPVTLPAGGEPEKIPVVIATGTSAGHEGDDCGPQLLLTANIHGPEYNGLIVAHRIIEWLEEAARGCSFAAQWVPNVRARVGTVSAS